MLGLEEMDWTKIFERKDVGRKLIGRKVGPPKIYNQETQRSNQLNKEN